MIVFSHEARADVAAREDLLDRCFGAARFEKSSERLREGRLAAEGLAFVAHAEDDFAVFGDEPAEGRLVGTVRLWHVAIGGGTVEASAEGDGRPALMLGPLAVDEAHRKDGIGAKLMRRAIAEATLRGHTAIILVGDPEYYERFGFSARGLDAVAMPGAFERRRLLGLELVPGALDGAAGTLRATGAVALPAAVPAVVRRSEKADIVAEFRLAG